MYKFQIGDIVLGFEGGWKKSPAVILEHHVFPKTGKTAYRMRDCLPQYDMVDGEELWPEKDYYMETEYVNQFNLLWRKDK